MTKRTILDSSDIFLPTYRGRLTEGVTYNPSNDSLIWVDIIQGEVRRLPLSQQSNAKYQILKFKDPEEAIGAIGLTRDDDIVIICGKYGIAKGNFNTGEINYFLEYDHDKEQKKRLRSNDGIIDPWGHLWVGVMSDFKVSSSEGKISPEGKLYRINCHDLEIETMVDNTEISNGLGFSYDNKEFYWTDSLSRKIWKFDYNCISNELKNRREFIDFGNLEELRDVKGPEPDGMAITIGDEIYSAVFKSGKVLHFDATGKCIEEFVLPCERITCVTIGGKNSDELFITTAHKKLDDFSCSIDPSDKTGDLGGFIFRVKLPKPEKIQVNIWGGR